MVHVKDIVRIINVALSTEERGNFRGERFIVSSGAYRICDLAEAADVESPPEILPLDDEGKPSPFFQRSKILSPAKLLQIIGFDYMFHLPLPGANPVSLGLPSTVLPLAQQPKFAATPKAHDNQWELYKHVSPGKWEADRCCYSRGSNNLATYIAEMRNESLIPEVSKICYKAYYMDCDSGIYDTGVKKIPICRRSFNSTDQTRSFALPGMSVFISSNVNQNPVITEINFFYKRQRSVMIFSGKPLKMKTCWSFIRYWCVAFDVATLQRIPSGNDFLSHKL